MSYWVELICKKAELAAMLLELEDKEQEEEEHNEKKNKDVEQAAKAARRAAKKHAREEVGSESEAKGGPKHSKRVKVSEVLLEAKLEGPLEVAEVACRR